MPDAQLPTRMSDAEIRAVLLRDKYHCTEQVTHRISGAVVRCPMVGSEMIVMAGRAMCPRHARAFSTQHDQGDDR